MFLGSWIPGRYLAKGVRISQITDLTRDSLRVLVLLIDDFCQVAAVHLCQAASTHAVIACHARMYLLLKDPHLDFFLEFIGKPLDILTNEL